MRKDYLFLSFLLFLIGFSSCKKENFLDTNNLETLDEEKVFADSIYTIGFLNKLYVDIDFDMTPKDIQGGVGGIFTMATDESTYRNPSTAFVANQIPQGLWGSGFFIKFDRDYDYLYGLIRHANIYLKNVDSSPLSSAMKKRTKAEARFLRVFYYHYLLRYYGGIPLVGDKVFSVDELGNIPNRSTFKECVDYLVNELDEIAPVLPKQSDYLGTLDYGRVTRGAALALKSRILLTAASPLFNGGSNAVNEPNVPGSFATNPELLKYVAYTDFKQERWEAARKAAKDVMDLNEYSLMVDNTTRPGNGFYEVFITRVNNEFIFAQLLAPGQLREQQFLPKTRFPNPGGAQHRWYPNQELVDMFPMRNGKSIFEIGSGYNEADPYSDRDPRLGYTVIYNGSLWYLRTANGLAPVYTYQGAGETADAIVPITSNTATTTGYYIRKGCNEQRAIGIGSPNEGSLPLIRYAEILLNYAEAANEMGQTAEAMEQIKQLRMRAGLLQGAGIYGYGLPDNPTKEAARLIIQNERAIELAFEESRFWDIKRWKIGGAILDGKPMHGMEITRIGNTLPRKYKYERRPLVQRYFKEESYLLPLPQSELGLNPAMLQNPGW